MTTEVSLGSIGVAMRLYNGHAKRKKTGQTLLEIMVVVGIIGLITTILIPAIFRHTRDQLHEKTCRNNLRMINDAKQRAGMDLRLTSGTPDWEQLKPYLQTFPLKCGGGGEYQIGDFNQPAVCSEHGALP